MTTISMQAAKPICVTITIVINNSEQLAAISYLEM
jgi:hypothetical protein